jgi:hypothetical protein
MPNAGISAMAQLAMSFAGLSTFAKVGQSGKEFVAATGALF